MSSNKQLGGGKKNLRSCQSLINTKKILKKLVDRSDIEYPAILRQIDLPNNDIPDFKDNPNDLEMDNDLLDRSQGQQQRQIIPPPILGPKSGDEKVKEEKKKRDNGEYRGGRKEVVGKKGGILEVSVY